MPPASTSFYLATKAAGFAARPLRGPSASRTHGLHTRMGWCLTYAWSAYKTHGVVLQMRMGWCSTHAWGGASQTHGVLHRCSPDRWAPGGEHACQERLRTALDPRRAILTKERRALRQHSHNHKPCPPVRNRPTLTKESRALQQHSHNHKPCPPVKNRPTLTKESRALRQHSHNHRPCPETEPTTGYAHAR